MLVQASIHGRAGASAIARDGKMDAGLRQHDKRYC
jgi:hypothetical protein